MKLSEYMKLNGISQREFARRILATEAAVSQYVAGKRTPSLELAVRIHDVTIGAVRYEDMILEQNDTNRPSPSAPDADTGPL